MIRPQGLQTLLEHANNPVRNGVQHGVPLTEEQLADLIEKLSSFDFVESEHVNEMIKTIKTTDLQGLVVINVLKDLKRYIFNADSFYVKPSEILSHNKSSIYRERFSLIRSRLMRNPVFNPAVQAPSSIQLSTIDGLMGCGFEKTILGILHQAEDACWFLEDLNRSVPVDLSLTKTSLGYFAEGAIILAQGVYKSGTLHLRTMSHPPIESIEDATEALPKDIWEPDTTATMYSISEVAQFIILFNVHLDDPNILSQLDKVFAHYQDAQEAVFVLSGNFSSTQETDFDAYYNYFGSLNTILGKYEGLCRDGMFVFIPGETEPVLGDFHPLTPIPKSFLDALTNARHVVAGSNPTRLNFYNKQMVIYRNDILRLIRRDVAVEPNWNESEDTGLHLAHTILRQSHLTPSSQILWDFDHALRLSPLPSIVAMLDTSGSYLHEIEECKFANPGSFTQGNFLHVSEGIVTLISSNELIN